MARATWSGSISFGLVNVPVQLFTAVRSHAVRFKQLHEGTNAPVKQKRVDTETGDEVPYDEIVKGYEVDDGRYVVVDPDELAALDPERSRMIDILDFVEQADIDPIYYDRAYYLSPGGEAAAKPYRLLTEAMERAGKVAIATFVMRGNSYLAAIRARDGLLVLSTMHYADEVADPADLEVDETLGDVEVREREVAMAEQLIDSLLTDFDPTSYRDEHQERVREFLEAKAEGQDIELPTPAEQTGDVVDLVAALERSLARARGDDDGGDTRASEGGRPDYASMTRTELYELAQERQVPGRSQLNKQELVAALRSSDEEAGAA
ncbi:Ku protein [Nitriliruptor alkaliphilus]|uniref:non-homologous end joining protein Ku n=1 Tax=Nitriliruptor alkaliphilus TaxID=427918 RepID=UPI000697082F|nr:Ku protein [Nitriliruptor alkaliphilus]